MPFLPEYGPRCLKVPAPTGSDPQHTDGAPEHQLADASFAPSLSIPTKSISTIREAVDSFEQQVRNGAAATCSRSDGRAITSPVEKLEAKEDETVSFASMDRPLDVEAHSRICDSPSPMATAGCGNEVNVYTSATPAVGAIKSPETPTSPPEIPPTDPPMDNKKKHTLPPSVVPYETDVQYDEKESYVIASFFRKPTYRVRISVGVTSQSMMTVASLFDTGAGPNLVNKSFIPRNWHRYVEPIEQPQLRTATREHVNVEGVIPMFVRIGDLRVRAWFGVVENLAVDILVGTSFIDRCIRGIFPTERKIVPWHSRPVSILTSSSNISSKFPRVEFLDHDGTQSEVKEDDEEEEFFLCRVSRPITIPADTQAAVSVSSQGAGLMLVETHMHLAKRRCSMAARGIMEIFPGKPFFLYVANLSGKPVHLPKHMIVAYASNSPKCIVHFRGTEPEAPGIPDDNGMTDTMTRLASKGKVKTPTNTAGIERNFGFTDKNEADSSNYDEKHDLKPHEVEENNDFTNKLSREIKNNRGDTSNEENRASTPAEIDDVIHAVH